MNKFQTPHVAINPSHCTRCWKCIQECPKHAIGKVGFLWHKHVAFCKAESCIGCMKCRKTCPNGVFFVTCEDIKVPSLWQRTRRHIPARHILTLSLVVTFITGIGLHCAGHAANHQIWHRWAVAHMIFSTVCFISVASHIRQYAALLKTTSAHRVHVVKRTLTLSTASAFILTSVTGFILLAFIDGESSHIGLWHFGLGIAMLLLTVVHRWNRP